MSEPSLFDEALQAQPSWGIYDLGRVRLDHPETSHEAAQAIAPKAGTYRAVVLRCLAEHPQGLTDEQIQDWTNMPASTERPRRVELVEQGLVRDSGDRRKTRSGRNAIVWEAC